MNRSSNVLKDLLKKEVSTSCKSDGDEEYFDNKEIAFETCYEKLSCYAIYDEDCDAQGPFETCKSPENVKTGVGSSSCIYRKIIGDNIALNIYFKFLKYAITYYFDHSLF